MRKWDECPICHEKGVWSNHMERKHPTEWEEYKKKHQVRPGRKAGDCKYLSPKPPETALQPQASPLPTPTPMPSQAPPTPPQTQIQPAASPSTVQAPPGWNPTPSPTQGQMQMPMSDAEKRALAESFAKALHEMGFFGASLMTGIPDMNLTDDEWLLIKDRATEIVIKYVPESIMRSDVVMIAMYLGGLGTIIKTKYELYTENEAKKEKETDKTVVKSTRQETKPETPEERVKRLVASGYAVKETPPAQTTTTPETKEKEKATNDVSIMKQAEVSL